MANPLNIGMAGLGTVGSEVAKIITQNASALAKKTGHTLTIAAVSAKDRNRDRGVNLNAIHWYDNPLEMAQSPNIDIIVELIGGAEGIARELVETALKNKKHVVTANKALIAAHGNQLAALAEQQEVSLNFEAAVAGGIPVIKTLRESLTANKITRIYGILNGTCNYILTRMENDNLDFPTCLKEAQRLGYAESDPSFDINGDDTAHKLAILAALAFGTRIEAEKIHIEGIRHITPLDIQAASELGYKIKLLGIANLTSNGSRLRVHPTMIPKAQSLARIDGVLNAVAIDGDAINSIMLTGPGAGGSATASAIIADIADIARNIYIPPLGAGFSSLSIPIPLSMSDHQGSYYVRLSVKDKPGGFAAIAGHMAEHNISLESIVQRSRAAHSVAPASIEQAKTKSRNIVLITYATSESALQSALQAIAEDDAITEPPISLRIQRFG